MNLRIFPSLGALLLTSLLPALTARAEDAAPVTREAALASLAENQAAWPAKIKSLAPRLLFSEAQWPEVMREVNALSGTREQLRNRLFEDLDKAIAKPLPEYKSPEQVVAESGGKKTLYGANEELWQRDVGNEIFSLAIAARMKPEPRYGARLHDLVMRVLTFETWGRSYAKMGNNADLAAGHLTRGIALAYDWHRDLFTDEERAEIRRVIAERLPCLLKALYGDAFWATGYGENHNHVSVTGLAYCGVAFYDEIPGAPEWLAAARLDFQNVGRQMAADGSSVEGVSYWTYGMSFILQYIEGTRLVTDAADLYKEPFLQNAAGYRLMASASGLTGNLPWGDAMPKDVWGGPQHILYRLAAEYGDGNAAWLADHLPFPSNSGVDERMTQVLWARNAPPSGPAPAELDTHLKVSDLVSSRTGWEANDYLLAIKSGYSNRNHSHLDAGALALAMGEDWMLVAPGYGKGSGDKDFWQRDGAGPRWHYFSNATESHATLLVNGKNQRYDTAARGTVTEFFSAPQYCWTSIDLGSAYQDVKTIRRSVLHRRGDYILVLDSITADEPVKVEWLTQFHTAPVEESDGAILAPGKNGKLRARLLGPGLPLTRRQPTTLKFDVAADKHFTYAAAQTGKEVHFTGLLQPILKGKEETPLKTEVGAAQLTIAGAGWTDYLAYAETSADLKPPGTTGARVQGKLALVRMAGPNVTSFLALGATSVEVAGLSYRSAEPCDLAARREPDGAWLVTASREVKGEVSAGPSASGQIHFAP